MTGINSKLLVTIILISIILILVILLVRFYISVLYEKRIKRFSLEAPRDNYESFSDKSVGILLKFTKFLSKKISKSDILTRYSKRFEKYHIYTNSQNSLEPMDYISIKFEVMFAFQILYIITLCIKFIGFNMFTFLLLSIFGFFVVDIITLILFKKNNKIVEDQLLQAIVIMNGAFKSGKNINAAIDIVRKELPNPIKSEFDTIYKDITYGLSLYEAFDRFADRIKIEQARYITASLSLLAKTGGNIVTVFNMIEKNFYNRMKIKNELDSLTSSSKFLYKLLCFIPFGILLLVVALDPTYFEPLVTTELGIIVILIMVVIYIAYLVIIKKVMKVDEV